MKKSRNILAEPATYVEIDHQTWSGDPGYAFIVWKNGREIAHQRGIGQREVEKFRKVLEALGVTVKEFRPGEPEKPRWLEERK